MIWITYTFHVFFESYQIEKIFFKNFKKILSGALRRERNWTKAYDLTVTWLPATFDLFLRKILTCFFDPSENLWIFAEVLLSDEISFHMVNYCPWDLLGVDERCF